MCNTYPTAIQNYLTSATPHYFIVVAVGIASIACNETAASARDNADRPNVVVILSDDQGWADIGYNNPRVYSPHLDTLAAGGATFVAHYVMPQCTPTRVALMTGRYPGRFGNSALQANNDPAFPLGTPTVASMFQASDYETAICGKWHLGSSFDHGPSHFGFDHSYGSLAGAVGMYDHRYRAGEWERTWYRRGELVDRDENGTHATDLVAQEAIRFIERERDSPFFLYVPFHSVHTPLDERGKFVDRPTQRDPANPERWLNESEIKWFNDPDGKIQSETDPEKRLFLAAVHHLDHAVGKIVAALDDAGLRENTLVIFSSDNGPQGSWAGNAYPSDLKLTEFNQPLPMRGLKTDVWEGGIHVPALANWPGQIDPQIVEVPVHIVDWFPTLSSLINHQPKPTVAWDGFDISPLFMSSEPGQPNERLLERDFYWIWNQRVNRWALRSGDWKIVKYGRDEPTSPAAWQLYNLASDPKEERDVAVSNPGIVAALHEKFLRQRALDK